MSFLKKYNIVEKFKIIKQFFDDHVLIKSSLHSVGISLIASLIVIQFSIPQFYVSATLREAQTAGDQGEIGGERLAGIFTGGGNKSNIYDQFRSNMHSYVLAQRMWDQGWGSKIFGDGTMDEEYFNTIPKNHTIGQKAGAFLLGYDLFEYYSAHDLQAFIKAKARPTKEVKATNIIVYVMDQNKDFAIDFLNAVILETDRYAKEHLIVKSKEIIAETYKQLATSRNSSITSALANTINSEFYKIASLENDLPYHIYFIDPPHSSEYPVTPKVSSIIFSNLIIFLFLSIAYSFIQKNKEDLW
jgi:hypothetical protein